MATEHRAFFGYPDWSDAATWVEATPSTPNVNQKYPLVKLKTDQPQDRFQSLDVSTTIKLQGTLPAAMPLNFISAMWSNASAGCTYTIKGSGQAGSMGATDAIDYTGTNPFWPTGVETDHDRYHSVWFSQSSISVRYLEIEIDDVSPANPDGFWTCGRLFVGDLWRCPLGYGSGLFGFADEGASQTHRSGVTSTIKGNPIPKLPINILSSSRTEMMQRMYNIARRRGGTRSVLLFRDPLYTDAWMQSMYYGVIDGDIIPIEGSFEYYSLRTTIRGMT